MKIPDRIARRFPFSSLRVRLQVLVWVAIVPVLLLVVCENLLNHSRKEAEIMNEAVSMVNLASGSFEQYVAKTKAVLLSLSYSEALQKGDPALLSAFLRDMHKHYPEYANFGAVDLQGNVFASAVPLRRPVNAADMFWFQQTMKTRDFTIGEYQIGRITGLEVIVFGQPVFDRTGKMRCLLFASMDLKWLNRLWEHIKPLPDSTFTITDDSGIVLLRYPLPADKWIGKNMANVPIIRAMLSRESGASETDGLDAKNRLYAFTTRTATIAGCMMNAN